MNRRLGAVTLMAGGLLASVVLVGSPGTSAHGNSHPWPSPSPSLPPQDPSEAVFSTNTANDLLLRLDFRNGTAAVVNSAVDALVRKKLEGIAVRDDPPGVSVIAADSFGGKVVFYPNAQGPAKVTGQVVARIDAPDGVSLDTAGNLYLVSSPFGPWKKPRVWTIPRGGSRPGGYGNPVVVDPQAPADVLEDTKAVGFTSGVLQAGDLLVVAQRPATVWRYRKAASGWQRAVFIGPGLFPRSARPTGITFAPNRELLVSTFDGDILRFDVTGGRVRPDFASGCGNGRLKIATGIQEGKSRVFVANRSNGGKVLRFLVRTDGTGARDGAVDEKVNRPNGVGIASNAAAPTPAGHDVEVVPAPEITLTFDEVTEAGLTNARLVEFVDNRPCPDHECDQGLREFFPDDPALQALVPDATVPGYVQGIAKLLPTDPPGQPSGPSSFLLALIDTTAKLRRTVAFHAEEEQRGLLSPCAGLGPQSAQALEPRTFYAPETAPPKSEPDLVENEDGALFVDISDGCGSNKGSGWNFSLYLTGRDRRAPLQILDFKIPNLQRALDSFAPFIDASVFADLDGNLRDAAAALARFARTGSAADRDALRAALEEFRSTVDANPEAFDDAAAGRNVNGELMARARSALFLVPKLPVVTGPAASITLLNANPPLGSTVVAGQTVSYTLRVVTATDIPDAVAQVNFRGPECFLGDIVHDLSFAAGVPQTVNLNIAVVHAYNGCPSLPTSVSETFAGVIDAPTYAAQCNQTTCPWVLGTILATPYQLASPLVITEFRLPSPDSFPWGITAGPDGSLWFAENIGNRIGRVTPTGEITEFSLPTLFSHPMGITTGPDGKIWFTEYRGDRIGSITTSGLITEYPLPTAGGGPSAIVTGPDGSVWFTEWNANQIGRITTAGVVTEFPVPTPGGGATGGGPQSIALGPDGNLWFTEESGNNIGRITPSGVITEFPVPTPGSAPGMIVGAPDGNLWFTESQANKIGRITPGGVITEYPIPTANSGPLGIGVGPDGDVWFAEQGRNKLGRITPSGEIIEFKVPTAAGQPVGIVAGPDGNLWFTETNANKIGRLGNP